MKNYFCMTHYHIMCAIIDVLRTQEEGRIYIGNGYTKFSDDFVEKVEAANVFSKVVKWETTNIFKFLPRDWATRLEESSEIKEKYEEFMRDEFDDINFEKETVCCFSPRHYSNWFFYEYAYKMQKFEDGYANHAAELMNTERMAHEIILEKIYGFPKETFLLSSKMDKIITSRKLDVELSNEEVNDFKYFLDNDQIFKSILKNIYEIPKLDKCENDTIFATSPIFKNKFQQHLFIMELIRKYTSQESKLVIKPHPADMFDYSFLKQNKNVEVLTKTMPIELLNFQAKKVKLLLSISSTANKLCNFFQNEEVMYDPLVLSTEEIRNKLEVHIFENMRISLSKENLGVGELYSNRKIPTNMKKTIFEVGAKRYPLNFYKMRKNERFPAVMMNKVSVSIKGFENLN